MRTALVGLLLSSLLLAPAALADPPYAASAWVTSVVDGAKYGAYCSQVVLPNGQPAVCHIERATGNLLYTTFDGTAWRTTVVDSTMGDARWCSLALLPDGNPAIAYCDYVRWYLKYAWFDGTAWHRTVVDNAQWAGDQCSLAILPSGRPAIAYHRAGLRYATFDGTAWQITLVDPDFSAGLCTSIQVLPSGQPAISYYRDYYFGDKYLGYATFDGSAWTYQVVEASVYAMCLTTSLAILPSGEPAIAWSTLQDGVRYAWHQNGQWNFSQVYPGGRYSALAIAADGEPAISLLDPNADQLLYARQPRQGQWDVTFIDADIEDQGLDGGRRSSLVTGPAGEPRVAYVDIPTSSVKYATADTTGVWHPTLAVAGGLDVGKYASAAVLANGQLAIACQDETKSDLKYAWRDGRAWRSMVVDEGGAVGVSLAVRPAGPVISYYDPTTGDLKIAAQTSGGIAWQITTIDTAAAPPDGLDVFTSIAVLPSGNPAISYCRTLDGDQRYAWFDGVHWQKATLLGDLVGRCSSLVILPNGQPAITYRRWNGQANNVLTYATQTGLLWQYTDIDKVTTNGWSGVSRENSLAIQPTSLPAVAYYEQITNTLKYAWQDALGWHTVTVDNSGDVGDHCALAFLSNGDPAISYLLKGDAMDLRYAWWDLHSPGHSSRWQTSTVASAQSVGFYTSLVVLPPYGQVVIAYYNWTNAALMLAERLTAVPVP